MVYDTIDYWSKQIKPNADRIEESYRTHLAYIKEHVSGCNKLLDFGPGDGRLFEAYRNVVLVEGFDITDVRSNVLYEQAKIHNIKFNLTVKKIIGELPYENKLFNVSIATEVLLHQKPKDINSIMSELIRVSDKVVVITWMEDRIVKPAPHCFQHDYFELCKKNNWLVSNFVKYRKSGMFVYRENGKLL